MVGVLVGHHGTCHIFCNIWHGYGVLCVFCVNETGNFLLFTWIWIVVNTFCVFSQDYLLPDIKDRQQLIALHKSAKKSGLDLAQYNNLKREIAVIENDIRRLRDPLCLHLPAPPVKSPTYSETEITTAKKIKDFIAEATGGGSEGGGLAGFTSKLQRSELLKISNLLQKLKSPKK